MDLKAAVAEGGPAEGGAAEGGVPRAQASAPESHDGKHRGEVAVGGVAGEEVAGVGSIAWAIVYSRLFCFLLYFLPWPCFLGAFCVRGVICWGTIAYKLVVVCWTLELLRSLGPAESLILALSAW